MDFPGLFSFIFSSNDGHEGRGVVRPKTKKKDGYPRGPLDAFAGLAVFRVIFINPRRASFTESSSGKAFATSGLRRTRLVPFLYSLRMSSCLDVFIYLPFFSPISGAVNANNMTAICKSYGHCARAADVRGKKADYSRIPLDALVVAYFICFIPRSLQIF